MAELAGEFDNVTFHIGDSAELLPRCWPSSGARAAHVDFALVDAAHTREAVRGDGAALLAAEACRQTVIVFHDSVNAEVRAGLEDLDLPDTRRSRSPCSTASRATSCRLCRPASRQALNGLALVVLDADRDPDARGYDAPEFVPIPALHEAYAAAQEPPSPARGKAAAVGSAAAVSAIVGAAAGVLIGRRRR